MEAGPWDSEPDALAFEAHGFPCAVIRHPRLRHLSGYVGVPKGHPWFERDDYNIDAECHGGLTFSGSRNDERAPWWLGFDCAHYGDVVPSMAYDAGPDERYRSIAYVERETRALAEQASKAPPLPATREVA
jgi:hypothetical protein